ncbi:MAG: HAD family hydrolase [Dehalococcoidia bacterium]|jgi:phosphoglycolate phosphatase|nr:HAD family hydrolase [Dehalococcoidia bacterium]MDP7470517.1 HAD family hydrolase [Dehalococcoidia bacterium]
MKYTGVVFDLDGTLLDTIADIAASANIALGRMGFPQHQTRAYKYFVGNGREMMALRALPNDHRDEATVDAFLRYIEEEYARHWGDATLPYDGIPELLDALTARGISMAVLSNKPHNFTELIVSKLLALWWFAPVVGAMPSVPMKPDPTAALQIARQFNMPPGDLLYVGDSGVDMITAVSAGMFAVGALWGFRTADELLSSGAQALIDTPTDLLSLL